MKMTTLDASKAKRFKTMNGASQFIAKKCDQYANQGLYLWAIDTTQGDVIIDVRKAGNGGSNWEGFVPA